MKTVTESLSDGIVSNKDLINLADGELASGTNGWFVEDNDGLTSFPLPNLAAVPLRIGDARLCNIKRKCAWRSLYVL
jgi:hypothetical protein